MPPQRQRAPDNMNNVSMTAVSDGGGGDGNGGRTLIEFPGIYQGFNLHSKAYILMTEAHCRCIRGSANSNMDKTSTLTQVSKLEPDDELKASQGFECYIHSEKVPYGWILGTERDRIKLPFNALVRCTLNVATNEILNIEPVVVSGSVNHVNRAGNTWILSDVKVDGMEQLEEDAASNIVSLRLQNVEDTTIQDRRGCSYYVHDPDQSGSNPTWKWRRGERVRFNVKLSTRTNANERGTRRLKFVQCYNVRPL